MGSQRQARFTWNLLVFPLRINREVLSQLPNKKPQHLQHNAQAQSQRTIIFATSLRAESGNPDGAGTYDTIVIGVRIIHVPWVLEPQRSESMIFHRFWSKLDPTWNIWAFDAEVSPMPMPTEVCIWGCLAWLVQSACTPIFLAKMTIAKTSTNRLTCSWLPTLSPTIIWKEHPPSECVYIYIYIYICMYTLYTADHLWRPAIPGSTVPSTFFCMLHTYTYVIIYEYIYTYI